MFEVRDLRLVHSVAECGTLIGASTRLHVTPSALSHQLRGLEQRLGLALFDRVGKRMVLTEAGRKLQVTAVGVLAELRRAEDSLAALATGQGGSLRISTACYTSYPWLTQLLSDFVKRHPTISLQVLPEFTGRPVDALRNGQLDAAIVFSPLEGADLLVRPFFDDQMVMLVPKGHALARRSYVRPQDFEGEDVLLYNSHPRGSILMAEILGPAGVAPRVIHAIPLTEAIVELVRSGRGVSFLANWVAQPFLKTGDLVAIPIGRSGFRRSWRVAVLDNGVAAEYVDELQAMLNRAATSLATQPRHRKRARA